MTLKSGARLGPYEIFSPLCAGGIGEVYRARDTRLNRDVAIKVLPASFANDEGRLRRFEQEATATSALNDRHIGGPIAVVSTRRHARGSGVTWIAPSNSSRLRARSTRRFCIHKALLSCFWLGR